KLTVDEIDGGRTVSHRLLARIAREAARRNDQTLLGSPHHGAPKVANGRGADGVLVTLALETDTERKHSGQPDDPVAVDATVATSARHRNLNEAGFSK